MSYPLVGEVDELLGCGRGSGVNRSYVCPFHDDRSPSLSVHMIEGMWNCFACGKKGTLGQLYYRLGENEPENRKLERLARLAEQEPVARVNFAPTGNYLLAQSKGQRGENHLREYCKTRPIELRQLRRFNVGYSPESDATAFIYWQPDESVSAIKYRRLDGSKFYETGSKWGLYGITEAIGREVVYIAEGESDTLAIASHLPEGVGVCGSPGAGVSDETWALWGLDLLFARLVYICFDADDAGDKGAEVVMRVLGTERAERLRPTAGNDFSEHFMNGGLI